MTPMVLLCRCLSGLVSSRMQQRGENWCVNWPPVVPTRDVRLPDSHPPPSPKQADTRPPADPPWPKVSPTLLGSCPSAPQRPRMTAIAPVGSLAPAGRLLRLCLLSPELAPEPRPDQSKAAIGTARSKLIGSYPYSTSVGPVSAENDGNCSVGRLAPSRPSAPFELSSPKARPRAQTRPNQYHHRNRKVKIGRQVT